MKQHKITLTEGDSLRIEIEGYADALDISWDHLIETFLCEALNKVRARRLQQPSVEMRQENVGMMVEKRW